ncbi:MAG: hypothetical protein ACTSUE_14290 [Promethearchaeota archaeon]
MNLLGYLRKIGFLLVIGAAVLCLFDAALIIAWAYSLMANGILVNDAISLTCIVLLCVGFAMVTTGSASKKNLEVTVDEKSKDDDKKLVDGEYRLSSGDIDSSLMKKVIAVFATGIVVPVLIILIWTDRNKMVASMVVVIVLCAICIVGILISRAAGFVNLDVYEFSFLGYHVHETVLGILFIFVGLVFILLGNEIELYLGLLLFFSGSFFIGRDWKDFASGKIITRD